MHQIRQKKPKPSKRNATSSSIAQSIDDRADERCASDERARRSRCSIDDRAARSRRSRRTISSIAPLVGAVRSSDERRDLGSLFSLSLSLIWALSSLSLFLSLSFSGSYLKWKWGEKMIFGSKVKILVNRKSFSGKWYFPWQPNMWKMVKMISWNHFHPKQTHPKVGVCVFVCFSHSPHTHKKKKKKSWPFTKLENLSEYAGVMI